MDHIHFQLTYQKRQNETINSKENLNFQIKVQEDFAFVIPAGKWHNLTNVGDKLIKLYSIYAPPQHPFGTIHVTKEDAEN